jgi:hypothetical protein
MLDEETKIISNVALVEELVKLVKVNKKQIADISLTICGWLQ